MESWAETYPRDPGLTDCCAGLALTSTGKYELSIAEADKAIALDPDLTPPYSNRAFNQLYLNRLDDALLTVRRATERKLESAPLLLIPYFVAFLKDDAEGRRRAETVARKSPGLEDIISHLEALALARSGRLQDARRMSAVPVEIAQQSGRRERAACSKRAELCGKRFTGMRPPPGRAPARRSRLEEAATLTMLRRSRWPSRAICRNREPSPTISRATSRRIRRFNSCICRRFGPCTH